MPPRKPPAKKPAAKKSAPKTRPAGTVDPVYAKKPVAAKKFNAAVARLEAGNAEAKAAFLRAPGATEERWNEVMAQFGSTPIGITGRGGKQRIIGSYDYGTGKAVRGKASGKAAYQRYRSTIGATGGNLDLRKRGPLSNDPTGAADAQAAADTAASFVPYAEADTATTSYLRAQGKAYGQGQGAYRAGGTEERPTLDSSVIGEDVVPGPLKRKGKKRVVRSRTKSGKKVVRTRRGGKVVKKTVGGKRVPVKKKAPAKKPPARKR